MICYLYCLLFVVLLFLGIAAIGGAEELQLKQHTGSRALTLLSILFLAAALWVLLCWVVPSARIWIAAEAFGGCSCGRG